MVCILSHCILKLLHQFDRSGCLFLIYFCIVAKKLVSTISQHLVLKLRSLGYNLHKQETHYLLILFGPFGVATYPVKRYKHNYSCVWQSKRERVSQTPDRDLSLSHSHHPTTHLTYLPTAAVVSQLELEGQNNYARVTDGFTSISFIGRRHLQ